MDSTEAKTPPYMVYCVLVACLESLANGWVIGSPNVPGEVTHNCATGNAHIYNKSFPDCLPMSTSLWGFAVASFCVGGLIGGLAGGEIQSKLGRKNTIMANTSGFIVGSVLVALSVHPAMFIVGRILCGLSCGVGSLVVPTYIGEISTIRSRGKMGACNQFLIVIGILLSTLIGLPLANVPLWRLNYGLAALPALVQLAMISTCVESPRWLVSVNRIDEAHNSLKKLRGEHNIDKEFYEIVEAQIGSTAAASILKSYPETSESIKDEKKFGRAAEDDETLCRDDDADDADEADDADDTDVADEDTELESKKTDTVGPKEIQAHPTMNVLQIFADPVTRRIAIYVLCLHAIQQLIGMNAVMYYSTLIFQSAFPPQTAQIMAIIDTVVNFLFTVVAVAIIDKVGRRPLLLTAEAGATLFSVLLVIGYRFNISALLVVAVFGYVASFAIGIGPIPWLITSELSPTYASSSVGAVATCVNWAMNFLIAQIFPVIYSAIQGYSFAIFAGVGVLSFIFTFIFIPETKNQSIESIVRKIQKEHG